ncbi:hypothetical protein OKA04_02845 [Luteolibacter flavescens]|uniref:HEAT repeat domain-containing protein n=1 Tax=Luteolibacter flavescens TaxID=1859460 RepID=A0ABT3FJW6_9BACT|nr:hypothetical protein [Luteolibacter flavescens]MCW1883649.1 hypothetical protein [Luteolibacter flavescens]
MRLTHSTAAVLLLFISSCEKKEEETTSSDPAAHSRISSKSSRTERRDLGSAREAEAKTALRKALDEAELETDPVAREKALAKVAWDAIEIDRAIAERAFAGLTPGGEESKRLIAHFASSIAGDDAAAALEWARGLPQPEERDDAIGRVAVALTTTDLQQALALVEEVPEGVVRDRTQILIAQRWSQSSPQAAADWVKTMPEGRARTSALNNMVNTWIKSNPAELSSWASKQADFKPQVAAAVASSMRLILDQPTRDKQLSELGNSELRALVDEELKKNPPPQFPPLIPGQ